MISHRFRNSGTQIQSTWVLWWTECYWIGLSPTDSDFLCRLSFHQCFVFTVIYPYSCKSWSAFPTPSPFFLSFSWRWKRKQIYEADGNALWLLQYCQLTNGNYRSISRYIWNVLRYFKICIYLFIPRIFAEPLTMFCGTVVGKHRTRYWQRD